MNRKPNKRAAPDLVCDGLRHAILSGELAQGMPLRQDQLAEQFGTSRIPVREALRQLEAEGLVRIEPNKGARVTPLSLAALPSRKWWRKTLLWRSRFCAATTRKVTRIAGR